MKYGSRLRSSLTGNKSRQGLSRRSFIRGSAATIIGLPLLELMMNSHGEAYADGTDFPCRFIFYYCPTSLVVSSSGGNYPEGITPGNIGMNYDVKNALQPIVDRNLQPYVSVISGLFAAPFNAPGGYNSDYHGAGPEACITGVATGFPNVNYRPEGPSPDFLVGEAIGGLTPVDKLVYQIDPDRAGGSVSFAPDGNGGFSYVEAQTSPAQAYRNLFSNFTPDDPDETVELERRLRQSSLSYAGDQLNTLQKKLGASDKQRLDQYLTSVRELEGKLLETIVPAGANCVDPALPGDDPTNISTTVPDQEARASLFMELTAMAMACDLTRTVSITCTNAFTGAGMRHELWNGIGGLHADVQHASTQADLDTANRWFIDQWAELMQRLNTFPEGTGNMLDNTAAIFMMEGGKAGREADGGGDPNHSTDNMTVLLAGRAGGLQSGQHVQKPDIHPAAVTNTALRAIGIEQTMGDITDVIDELLPT